MWCDTRKNSHKSKEVWCINGNCNRTHMLVGQCTQQRQKEYKNMKNFNIVCVNMVYQTGVRE